jgi:phosphoglycerol transferase MdoB-like AlkP superfamily enzyme
MMLFFKRIPRLLRWIVSVGLVFLIVMILMRFVFYIRYNPPGKPFSAAAMFMGLRFDLKFVCIFALCILTACSIPFINPIKNIGAKKGWNIVLPIIFVCTIFFYAVDYFYYDYLRQRINASIQSYLVDASISANMVWQTYPLVKIIIALILIFVLSYYGFKRLLFRYQSASTLTSRSGAGWHLLYFLLFGMGIFGKVGQFNLRWSDAFLLNDTFNANLALNPFQSFFSTLSYRNTLPDSKKVKEGYPMMAALLGVQQPDSALLNFERKYTYAENSTPPNVVVVICESFSMYKSSMSGNPMNTTPFFNALTQKGVFFDRCFTPSYPTARGVWATVTGIPDVLGDNNRTASRNPEVVDQRVIINDLKGYEKFYFLGGDPTWANIKGLLLNNIEGLQIFSQETFKASKVDVWGIDDKNLFLEANQRLALQQKPFFAIIQTADNHPPYTIPAEDAGEFKKVNYPKDTLNKYGFASIEQLNAFRYTDFCFQKFFTAAAKEKYFDNTIFVFVGDHGIPGNSNEMYPKAWVEKNLSNIHVPLLFYAPKILQPEMVHNICSQLDIMPSVASLIKMPHSNTVMGKNLFDSNFLSKDYAFVIDHESKSIGIVHGQYYYIKYPKFGKAALISVVDNEPVPENAATQKIKDSLNVMTDAYYETAKYMLFNNKKNNHK